MKANFHVGFHFLAPIILATSCCASDARVVRLASPDAAVGADTVKASDVEIEVSFTPIAGRIDQAAGLMFRVKDANNYYVARANALENNVNLYHVVGGVRTQIAGVNVPVRVGKTQQLGARIEGDAIKISFEGRPLINVSDRTIQGSGAIGLWTKADSLTAFYELTISALKE